MGESCVQDLHDVRPPTCIYLLVILITHSEAKACHCRLDFPGLSSRFHLLVSSNHFRSDYKDNPRDLGPRNKVTAVELL